MSAFCAAAPSWPGGMRIETRARADGTSWLVDPSMRGESIPRMEIAGFVHMRAVMPPSPMS